MIEFSDTSNLGHYLCKADYIDGEVVKRIPSRRPALRGLLVGTALATLVSGAAAHAQTVATSDSGSAGLEEIVVTAQKRAENLQKVPVAVSVVTANQLTSAGITDMPSLVQAVPGLIIQNSNGYGYVSLRGVGSLAVAPGFDLPVAFYVDDVVVAAQTGGITSLNNIAQIEVLKGPQGTLFGRNATGGLMHIKTREPTEQFQFQGDLSYANYQTVTANAYVGGGLADGIAADLAVRYKHQGDGWGTNLTTGKDVYKTPRDMLIRSKWIFRPSDQTKITAIADYNNTHNSINAFMLLPGTHSVIVPNPLILPRYDITGDIDSYSRAESGGGSIKIEQEIGSLDLTSITAIRRAQNELADDFDFSAAPVLGVYLLGKDRQFTQEFQLSSKSDGKFKWTAGLFYFNGSGAYDPVAVIFPSATLPSDLSLVQNYGRQSAKSFAGYFQGTFDLTDSTRITAGGRYTWERHGASGRSILTFANGVRAVIKDISGVRSRDKVPTFRFSVDQDLSDNMMAYASFNRGFKSGGFNTTAATITSYAPEKLNAYEVGLKSDMFDRTLRLNVAGFYYDYTNMQLNRLLASGTEVINAATSRTYGIDVDATAAITRDLTVNASASYLDAKFKSFPNAPTATPGGGVPSFNASAKGNRLPLASKFTSNVAIDYNVPISTGKLNLHSSIYYNDGFFYEPDNVVDQKSYWKITASITWTSENDRLSASLWANNITNSYTLSFATAQPDGTQFGNRQEPRTYGITLGYKI